MKRRAASPRHLSSIYATVMHTWSVYTRGVVLQKRRMQHFRSCVTGISRTAGNTGHGSAYEVTRCDAWTPIR